MLLQKRCIISADERQMGDGVHENKRPINIVIGREIPSKDHHLNIIPLRLLASVYKW
jgi:hypothetical protein